MKIDPLRDLSRDNFDDSFNNGGESKVIVAACSALIRIADAMEEQNAVRGPAPAASPAPVGAEREAVERLIEAGDRMRTFLPDGNDKAAWLPKQNWKRSLAALRAIQGAAK